MITKDKIAIWNRMGSSISDCIIAERARRLGLSINVSVGSGAGASLAEAKKNVDAWFAALGANPTDEAWRAACKAAADFERALDQAAPASAKRDQRSAAVEDDDADVESARNPFTSSRNSLSRRVGEAIQRVAGPMLEAAGGAGLGTVAMPLTLSATELAVCSSTNVSPEEYLATKKRNALMRR